MLILLDLVYFNFFFFHFCDFYFLCLCCIASGPKLRLASTEIEKASNVFSFLFKTVFEKLILNPKGLLRLTLGFFSIGNGTNDTNLFDTFKFLIDIPVSWHDNYRIEFCVCFAEQNGTEHWDNNDGLNYSIVSGHTSLNTLSNPRNTVSTDVNSPLYAYWLANSGIDEMHPYW